MANDSGFRSRQGSSISISTPRPVVKGWNQGQGRDAWQANSSAAERYACGEEIELDETAPMTSVKSNLPEETDDFPEGGWAAWIVVFGSWCSMTGTFGIVNSSGFLQAYLVENQLKHLSNSQVSWIFSVYLFLFFFGGVQVGPIFDAHGLEFVLIPGCVGCVASLFILSVCKSYYQFLLGFGVLGGLSSTLVFTPSITVIGHWFYKRRGLATGIAASGGATGGVIFPLVMNKLITQVGYGWTIRIMAFIVMVLCIVTVLTLKTRLPLNKAGGSSVDFRAFKDVRFALTTVAVFMIELALFIPLTYVSSYALYHGIDSSLSFQLLAILNAGSVFGRGLPGYVADIFGRFNVMIVTTLFCSITCLAIWLPAGSSKAALVVFSLLFGFGSGTGICLTPVCVSQVCRTEDYGKRYGTCYFVASFGVLTGLPMAGAIQNRQHGDYQGLIIFSGLTYFAAALFFIWARVTGAGWSLRAIY